MNLMFNFNKIWFVKSSSFYIHRLLFDDLLMILYLKINKFSIILHKVVI